MERFGQSLDSHPVNDCMDMTKQKRNQLSDGVESFWFKSHLSLSTVFNCSMMQWILLVIFTARFGSALDWDKNASQCVSNRGLPYTKDNCEGIAKAFGCIWQDNQCLCANKGTYAKRSHYCWPPKSLPTTTTTTTPVLLGNDNASICRSNSGHPYDKDHCNWVAKSYGCHWFGGHCVCQNGGTYAKSSHYCWPPSDPVTTTTTTLAPATSTPAATGSTCVSNRGRAYDESDCKWVAKQYGCSWHNGTCSCDNQGTFSKTSKKCWPPMDSTPPPSPCKADCEPAGREGLSGVMLTLIIVGLALGGSSLAICVAPCTRQRCRRMRQRHQRALQGSGQRVLLDVEDNVEVVPTAAM